LRLDVKRRRYAVASAIAVAGFGALAMALPGRGAGLKVELSGYRFHPAGFTVHVGDAATFTNESNVTHTATCEGCGRDTGDIQPQTFKTLTFTKAGRYLLYCQYHRDRGMVAVITVKP
jgi:plastocyanin